MKKNIFYLILLLFFTFIFTVFYKGLDKPNFYTPKEANNKNFDPKIFTYERFLDDIYKTICKYTIRMMSTRLRPNGMKFLMAVVPGFKMATKESTFAFLVSYCV